MYVVYMYVDIYIYIYIHIYAWYQVKMCDKFVYISSMFPVSYFIINVKWWPKWWLDHFKIWQITKQVLYNMIFFHFCMEITTLCRIYMYGDIKTHMRACSICVLYYI